MKVDDSGPTTPSQSALEETLGEAIMLDSSHESSFGDDGTVVYTPKRAHLAPTSPFVRIERLFGLDHGGECGEKQPIISVACHPARRDILATGGHEGGVRVWEVSMDINVDPTTSEHHNASRVRQITTLTGHRSQVNAVRFSPGKGDRLASCSSDASIRMYSTSNWKIEHILRGHTLDITDIAWFTMEYLLSCSADGQTILWDAKTGGKLQTLVSSSQGSIPKGITVASSSDYVCVLYEDSLLDVFAWKAGGSFRHTRHLDLKSEDKQNFARAPKSTLYPRRGSWLGRDLLVLPLGQRARTGPVGVIYGRDNLLEPTPGEIFKSEKVLAGHPARVVVVACKPGEHRGADTTTTSFICTVSVDGVLCVWSMDNSNRAISPACIVTNLLDPLAVCTDACWAGNTLFLSSSDGAVTAVELFNVGEQLEDNLHKVHVVPEKAKPSVLPEQGASFQTETQVKGRRRIQPVVIPSIEATPVSTSDPYVILLTSQSSADPASIITARNEGAHFSISDASDSSIVFSHRGTVTAITHNSKYVVIGHVIDQVFTTRILSKDTLQPTCTLPVLMSDKVTKLHLNAEGQLIILTGDCGSVCVWNVLPDSAVHAIVPEAVLTGLFRKDVITSMNFEEELVVTLASGNQCKYNANLHRWTLNESN